MNAGPGVAHSDIPVHRGPKNPDIYPGFMLVSLSWFFILVFFILVFILVLYPGSLSWFPEGRPPASGPGSDPRRSPWGRQRAEPMIWTTFSNNSEVVAFSAAEECLGSITRTFWPAVGQPNPDIYPGFLSWFFILVFYPGFLSWFPEGRPPASGPGC